MRLNRIIARALGLVIVAGSLAAIASTAGAATTVTMTFGPPQKSSGIVPLEAIATGDTSTPAVFYAAKGTKVTEIGTGQAAGGGVWYTFWDTRSLPNGAYKVYAKVGNASTVKIATKVENLIVKVGKAKTKTSTHRVNARLIPKPVAPEIASFYQCSGSVQSADDFAARCDTSTKQDKAYKNRVAAAKMMAQATISTAGGTVACTNNCHFAVVTQGIYMSVPFTR